MRHFVTSSSGLINEYSQHWVRIVTGDLGADCQGFDLITVMPGSDEWHRFKALEVIIEGRHIL